MHSTQQYYFHKLRQNACINPKYHWGTIITYDIAFYKEYKYILKA